MKRLLTLLMGVLVMVAMTAPCVSAAGVTYVGGAEKFVFTPGTEQYPTDLFPGFKGVMPGDTLTEQIEIKNTTSSKYKIKVYMRSLGAQEDTDDFLSQLKLTVTPVGKTDIFEAPADETAQLTNWTHLGTLKSGGKITLDVTLEVPIDMDDDYQNKIGYIDWQFKIEEIPIDSNVPGTGDDANISLYVGMMILSLAALAILLFLGKRRKQEDDN